MTGRLAKMIELATGQPLGDLGIITLDQVKGWSKARPVEQETGEPPPDRHPSGFARELEAEPDRGQTKHGFARERKPGVALFGGWRITR